MNNSDASRCLAQLDSCRPLIRRLAPHGYDPEDIFQDVYVAAAHGPTSREWSRPQGGWLRTVVRNIAIRNRRRQAVRQCQSLTTEPGNNDDQEPIAQLQKNETKRIVRDAVETLKPSDREVIERRFFAEQPFSQIAHDLGIPEQTIRTRCKRAIKRLRTNTRISSLS